MATSHITDSVEAGNTGTKGPRVRKLHLVSDALREITLLSRAISVGTESIDDNLLELFTLPAARTMAQRIGWLADTALAGLGEEQEVGNATAWMFPDLKAIEEPST